MKKLKYSFRVFIILALVFTSCQEDDVAVGAITAPSNIQVVVDIVGADAANPNGDGSGTVNFTASADNAISYQFVYNNNTTSAPGGKQSYDFSVLGLNTYSVTVLAFGTGGASSSQTIEVEVLSLYDPPADLTEMLHANSSREWRIKAESKPHFGLGPVGGFIPGEWFSAEPFDKAAVGMYDDRYIFNVDGTFTHITDSTNDDPTTDTSGTVFGRDPLINELGGAGGGTVDGADILNYPFSDYSEQWSLGAPGGVETLSLTGTAFMGYYTGGNHKYRIFSRSANEMVLSTADGNNEFEWWFTLTTEGEATNEFETAYTNLVWEDEFDTDGAPNPANWTYDLGTGTNGWGNNEVQTYTNNAENVIVEGGILKIIAKSDGSGGYTSARIKSEGLQQFTYGRIDVRAKLPSAQGTWPAIWMLGSNFSTVGWPQSGEIDLMEQTGGDKANSLGTLHWFDSGTNANASFGETTAVSDASNEFHIYSLDWSADKMYILIDNVPFFEFDNNAALPFNADFFFILNVAMGGTLGGTIDPGFTQDTMEIDYVKVYQ